MFPKTHHAGIQDRQRWAVRRLLFLLLVPLIIAGCGHKQTVESDAGGGKKDAPRPVVQVVPVTRQTLDRLLPVTGVLQSLPGQEAVLSPPVAGILDTLSARYAQTVVRGQVVARLSTRQLQGQIQQAEATLGQNQVQVQQAEANAVQQQAQTRTAILQAQAAVNNAQATLAGAQATLTGDEATLHNTQQNLTRTQTLFGDGLVPQRDVEAAQVAVRTAQAAVDAQRQTVDGQRQTVAGQQQAVAAARAASLQDVVKLKDILVARQQVRNALGALDTVRAEIALYTLRAPLSGEVTVAGANVGETVDPATKILTITNLDRLQLQIAVPTGSASEVHAGQPVTFTVDSLPGRTFRTVIVRVGSQVDTATGTVPAYAVLSNPGHRLRDDTTVQAHILIERRTAVLTVPTGTILTDPDTGKPSVTVVGTDEVAHIVPVTLGLTADGRVELRSGVTEGQKVAVSGQYGVPDGTKVSTRNGTDGS
jgi:HlyD family secretion protein